MFNPGPDKWDLVTLSFVLQLMNGFHGVNGTAAVTLTVSYMQQAAVVISSCSHSLRLMQVDDLDRPCNNKRLQRHNCQLTTWIALTILKINLIGAVILSDVFYVGIFYF